MAKLEELRKVKDNATRAMEKRQFEKAGVLYLEIAEREPSADWLQRAGDAFRRGNEPVRAVEALSRSASGFAQGGFLLKAIAVAKTILQIDPKHTSTQTMLAELYAKRDSATAAPKVAPAPLKPPDMLEHESGGVSAPIEVLPLRSVLGGRRSEQLNVADIVAAAEAAPIEAYEIELDATELEIVDDAAEIVIPALPKIPLFSSLNERELQVLIERMTLRDCDARETIVKQGERGGSLFIVVDGEVRIVAGAAEVARLGAGAFFGELGLLTDDPRSATVETTQQTTLLEISRELFWEITRRSPDVLRTMLRFFRDRMLERLIGASPLFAGLSREDAKKLANEFVFLELEPNVVAVSSGQRSPGLFLLMCGEAEAVRDGARLGVLKPGDVFGEISLILHTPATADVRSTKKSWVLELPRARFQETILQYPQVLEYVSSLSEKRSAHLDAHSDVKGDLL